MSLLPTTAPASAAPVRLGRDPRLAVIRIGPEDAAEIAALPETVRTEVRRWAEVLGRVTPPVGQAMIAVGRAMGVSPSTARRKWDAALKSGWRGLIDRAKAPESSRSAAIHPATIEHFQKLVAANQRKARPAYRLLVRQFLGGEPIPGVAADVPRNRLPAGWSYPNLMRHAPTKFELTAFRIGRSAARQIGPLVFTTRRDLWVGSHYLFDDMVHDHFVNVLDTRRTGRPVEFHAVDLASACKFAWGMRVRTENEITGQMEGLREHQMRALVASVLGQHGYHAQRGTTMVVEHGTAAIREDLEAILHDLTEGKIVVRRSGIEGDPAHVGQYAGRPKGNFRFKAALESLGNLIHNEMGFLPGQTGLSVDRRPEEMHGLLRANDALVAAFSALAVDRPDLAGMLRFPILSHRQFLEIAIWVYHRINDRKDHSLEGWDLHVRPDETDWTRVRRMSPLEVWQGGRERLTRFTAERTAIVLYRPEAPERTVKGSMITFEDAELSSDELRYDASRWRDGEKFAALLNPYNPAQLYLYDARGRFVGAAPAIVRVDRADDEAVRRAMGRVNHVLSERLQPVAALGREMAQQRIADARHNAEVLAAAEATQARKPEAKARRAGAAIAASLGERAFEAQPALVPIEEDVFPRQSESRDEVEESIQIAQPGE